MTTAKELITRGTVNAFRKCSIKRLQIDGTYETDWYDISYYVIDYPNINEGFGDEVLLGEYETESYDLNLNNSDRNFVDGLADSSSLFYGFAGRKWTKVKIEVGLLDDTDTEVNLKTFYGFIFGDISSNDNGMITFPISSLLKVFELFPASGISGTSATTSVLIQRILDKQVNGVNVFDRYFEATESINPDSVSCTTISSPEIYDSMTCWKKMNDYSIYQDFFPSVDNTGAFVWRGRDPTGAEVWKLNGAGGTLNNDYGVNIISLSESFGMKAFWPRVTIEYADDTFYTSSTNWTPGDLSDVDLYGEKTFSITKKELSLAEATIIADRLKTNTIKREFGIQTVFLPLKVRDKVEINFVGESSEASPFVLGVSLLGGTDTLERKLGSASISGLSAEIIRVGYDIENMKLNLIAREI